MKATVTEPTTGPSTPSGVSGATFIINGVPWPYSGYYCGSCSAFVSVPHLCPSVQRLAAAWVCPKCGAGVAPNVSEHCAPVAPVTCGCAE